MPKRIIEKPPGVSVEDYIIRSFYDSLFWSLDDEEPEQELNPYAHYQGDPLGFCENILGIRFTEEVEELVQVAQDTPSTLAKSANGMGKTFAAACFALYWFLVYPDSQVYTLAAPPEDNLRLLLWGEIGAIVEAHPELFQNYSVSLPNLRITRNRRSFITGVAIPQSADPASLKSRFSGKHAPHLLFIIDEGDGVPAPIYEAIEACMSGGMTRQLVLFNPRAESGPVFQMERNGEGAIVNLVAFDHPNVKTGTDVIPGAVDRETTVRRINLWTEPLPSGERPGTDCFEVPTFLVGCIAHDRAGKPMPPLRGGWRRVIEPSFFYMVLGIYPTQAEDQLISSAWVDAAVTRWLAWKAQYGSRPPLGVRPVAGYDVAELGLDKNVFTLVYGSWVADQIEWSGVDIEASGNKAADIYLNNDCQWVNVDSTGVGAGAWARMKNRGCKAYRIMVQGSKDLERKDSEIERNPDEDDLGGFDTIRDQMAWGLREFLRTDTGAMLPPDGDLREELLAVNYTKNKKGKIIVSNSDDLKARLRRSPDKFMSLAIRWAKQPSTLSGKVSTQSYAYGGGTTNRTPVRGVRKHLARR